MIHELKLRKNPSVFSLAMNVWKQWKSKLKPCCKISITCFVLCNKSALRFCCVALFSCVKGTVSPSIGQWFFTGFFQIKIPSALLSNSYKLQGSSKATEECTLYEYIARADPQNSLEEMSEQVNMLLSKVRFQPSSFLDLYAKVLNIFNLHEITWNSVCVLMLLFSYNFIKSRCTLLYPTIKNVYASDWRSHH